MFNNSSSKVALTEIVVTVGKTRQERQYEPIKIEIAVKADVRSVNKDDIDAAFHEVRDLALAQLDISFEERVRFLTRRKEELEKMKAQRDQLDASLKELHHITGV